ncbi:hypothetical protein [Enterobacter sp. JJBC]|uniref:hypothetical protein n=1 Tax=Enterobacter sp. JJBC TaxID=3080020 RepID=UPI0030CAA081
MNFIQYFFYDGRMNRTNTKYSKHDQNSPLSPIAYVAESIEDLKRALRISGLYDKAIRQAFPKFIKQVNSMALGDAYRCFYTQNSKMNKPALGVCFRRRGNNCGSVLMLSADIIVEKKHSCVNARQDYFLGMWKKVSGDTANEFLIAFEDTKPMKARGDAMKGQLVKTDSAAPEAAIIDEPYQYAPEDILDAIEAVQVVEQAPEDLDVTEPVYVADLIETEIDPESERLELIKIEEMIYHIESMEYCINTK